jgi:hypothetical protein
MTPTQIDTLARQVIELQDYAKETGYNTFKKQSEMVDDLEPADFVALARRIKAIRKGN